MDPVHKKEYRVRDLPTRSVTLFPTRAQVVRDIKNVPLQPGINEISIFGLSPSVDEDSIQVEGSGSAIISDIAVELRPNRDIFEEIYPDDTDSEPDGEDDDDDDNDDDDNDDDDNGDVLPKDDPLAVVRHKIHLLSDDMKRVHELVASAESRLRILDSYGKAVASTKKGVRIEDGLAAYRSERQKVFQDQLDGHVRERALAEELEALAREERRLAKLRQKEREKAAREKAKARRAREKEREKERRRAAERRSEKARVRRERERFWPRFCWSVRITLDAVGFTPGSSRRSSVASAADLLVKAAAPPGDDTTTTTTTTAAGDGDGAAEEGAAAVPTTCDLSLHYVTSSAYWSPSYDLALSTTSGTGLLCFDARLTNKTSEDWAHCRLVLSTSQTTFAGLQDAIPTLVPWRIRLGGRGVGAEVGAMLDSLEERAEKGGWKAQQQSWGSEKARSHLYGRQAAGGGQASSRTSRPPLPPPPPPPAPLAARAGGGGGGGGAPPGTFPSAPAPFGSSTTAAPLTGSALLSSAAGSTLARSTLQSPALRMQRLSSSHEIKAKRRAAAPSAAGGDVDATGGANDDDDDETILERGPQLEFQESSFEETGLTTTYDLPGLKTLATSATATKQRVARVSFPGVDFSHVVVAKYRPAAYLKAKLRNASRLTLLKGPVGLTLDGSFLGRATLPRCSAGDSITLSLGVDPAISVAYPAPDVRRSTTGLFSKEDSSVYTRAVTLANTRAGAGQPVHLLVLDQVPVSEDDKLRVELLHPRGLAAAGPAGVRTGEPAAKQQQQGAEDRRTSSSTSSSREWGSAVARLRKAGEVAWDVVLNPGRSVKLTLEYEIAAPGGESIVQCYD